MSLTRRSVFIDFNFKSITPQNIDVLNGQESVGCRQLQRLWPSGARTSQCHGDYAGDKFDRLTGIAFEIQSLLFPGVTQNCTFRQRHAGQ